MDCVCDIDLATPAQTEDANSEKKSKKKKKKGANAAAAAPAAPMAEEPAPVQGIIYTSILNLMIL